MNIKELQEPANELKNSQIWREHSLEQRALFLVTEVGEIVKEVLNLLSACQDVDYR